MWFGAHLPLMDFGGGRFDLETLRQYVRAARDLGYQRLTANDHLVFSVAWLDGPTALSAVLGDTGDMQLLTSVALPVVRGPVPLAKSLAAIDLLSGGRLTVGVGSGSSRLDYAAAGVPFDERWKRLDEAVVVMRDLWRGARPTTPGQYYDVADVALLPRPSRAAGIPIWIGSWGSEAGLRRTARLGDGWLASAYNTTPEAFGAARQRLETLLVDVGRDPNDFPNGLATTWFHITDDPREAERMWSTRILPAVNRPPDTLRERLHVGPADQFVDKLGAFRDAGLQGALVWPVADEVEQLTRLAREVMPALRG